jgi:hypothetical protein
MAADGDFVGYGNSSDPSYQYVIWPAHKSDGVQHNISGDAFAIDSGKINAALCKYRPLIERAPNAAFVDGHGRNNARPRQFRLDDHRAGFRQRRLVGAQDTRRHRGLRADRAVAI